jgi:hypothetical protein
VREYCRDNLLPELHEQIPDICAFGARIPDFSYDMLRSVLFELNTYKCALENMWHILNIDTQSGAPFEFKVYLKSGEIITGVNYVNVMSKLVQLRWWNKTDGRRDELIISDPKVSWTGDDDGSLILTGDSEWELWKNPEDKAYKVILTPAKKGYLSENSYDDDSPRY